MRSPVAVSYLAQAPGALGLARAYVSGHLDVEGDMYDGAVPDDRRPSRCTSTWPSGSACCRSLGGPRLLLPRVPPPPQEVRVNRRWLAGRLHSKKRDATAISHHYDVSNTLLRVGARPVDGLHLRLLPDAPTRPWRRPRPTSTTWWPASSGLRPGCGCSTWAAAGAAWSVHAAREYGVKALGVTLSAQQAAWAQQAIEQEGLGGLAEVRRLDYREVTEGGFDALSSIGLSEHIGNAQLPGYFNFMYAKLLPGETRARSLHRPARRTRGCPRHRRLHLPLRVPGR